MAAPYYQNQNSFAVAVPTASGVDVNLLPGEVVQGEPYSIFDYENILTLVAGPYYYPTLRYSWPGSGSGSGGAGSITDIVCSAPITGGGFSGSVPIGLSPLGVTGAYIADGTITAAKLAAGAAVTGITVDTTTLTNAVVLTAGTNIVLTPNAGTNTIDIATDANLVSSITAVLPVLVTTNNGEAGVSLEVSLAVTPTDNGGAVALQSFTDAIVYQDGYAGLNGIHITADDSKLLTNKPQWSIGLYNSADNNAPVMGVAFNGSLHSTSDINTTSTIRGSELSLAETKTFDPVSGNVSYEDVWIDLQGNPILTSYFDVDVEIKSLLELGIESVRNPGTYGRITGYQNVANTSPLVTLTTDNATSVPVVKIATATQLYPNISGVTAFEYLDATNESLVKIHDNGVIDAKTINADLVNADQVIVKYETSTNVALPAGNYLVNSYPGVQVFVIDSSNGPSSITLPELDSSSVDGVIYTFKKYDITINPVVVASAVGQTIDYDQTQYVLRTYKQSHGVVTNTEEPLLHVLKVMSVVKPLAGKYYWISL